VPDVPQPDGQRSLLRYQNMAINAAQVIEEMIQRLPRFNLVIQFAASKIAICVGGPSLSSSGPTLTNRTV
jgi:hypothetical protein